MNILILGSGGREHAFAWKLSQSPLLRKLFIAPGNAGTSALGVNVPMGVSDFSAIATFCIENQIQIVVVGPEVPLVEGIKDYLEKIPELKDVIIVGPNAKGAQLEGSKDFSKNFMVKYGIPTAKAKTFTKDTLHEGLAYLRQHSLPIVLKADGLAAGKGVIIAEDLATAEATLNDMLVDQKFGDASASVLVEQFLKGIEVSVFVLTDGQSYVLLPEAKDYKRIGEKDTGPNTGGMGAVSPVPFAQGAFMEKVKQTIILPTLEGLKKEGIGYTGFIFFGLINVDGEPYVIEYNARMGDPETEAVLPRLKTDLAELFLAYGQHKLHPDMVKISSEHAATVIVVSGGYPEAYAKGKVISGLPTDSKATFFHAGTKVANGQVVTDGGRVLASTGLGHDLPTAIDNAYKALKPISFEGMYSRGDIGQDVLSA